jgi:hypothetical protein
MAWAEALNDRGEKGCALVGVPRWREQGYSVGAGLSGVRGRIGAQKRHRSPLGIRKRPCGSDRLPVVGGKMAAGRVGDSEDEEGRRVDDA